jgi:alpha-glucosidase/alpha-D-xyloside xylohydrolase
VFHNPQVEPICQKYLNLRYQLLPYLYSAVRESTKTGLPVLRSLWLHYPDDPKAVARGDVYLWGRDLLVAPIVEKGASSRTLYLPKGEWHDFWTGEKHQGGQEISKKVDLETMPLYVRSGAILPMDPVRQYTAEKVSEPTTISVYPGANGAFLLYADDGETFNYRKGDWMGVQLAWNDARRTLSMRLAQGSKMYAGKREFRVKAGDATKSVTFDGKPVEVKL